MKFKKVVLTALLVSNVAIADQTIEIISGVTPGTVVNSLDNSAFSPFDESIFTAADAGGEIEIISAPHANWLKPLTATPDAVWVGANENRAYNNSMLFAFPFTVTDTTITKATIQLSYAVDNYLGDSANGINGMFINNISQPAADAESVDGNYLTEKTTSVIDITSFVQTGNNVLYIYARDTASIAGLIAYANIQITGTQTPPVAAAKSIPTLALWGLFMMAVSFIGIAIKVRKQ